MVIEKLRDVTGLGLSRGENIMGETANADAFVEVSGILKAHAVNLIKISNDLRLLNFLGEIRLPQLSSWAGQNCRKRFPSLLARNSPPLPKLFRGIAGGLSNVKNVCAW
jgi:hypothetical protein